MKKWVTLGIVLTVVVLSLLIGDCYSKELFSKAYNEGYQVGYNEAYTLGYEEGRFFFYYTPLVVQQYGVENLEKCLDRTWKETAYKAGVFDCGEMSAFLEWYLENKGWYTKIKIGNSPDDSGGKHAWLLVETTEGEYMPVEATQWSIVYSDNPYFENYFNYATREFETIQEAIAYNANDFDWWASHNND